MPGAPQQPTPYPYGQPQYGQPAPAHAKRSSSPAGVAIGLLVLVGLAAGAYAVMSPRSRDDVNRVASGVGVPIVPWAERARTAAGSLYGAQGQTVANSILGVTHPTGTNAQLANYSVSVEGDQLVSNFDVSWNGGVLGAAYVTSVEWRCSQSSPGSARVTRDTAMIHVAATNAAELDMYFQTAVYKSLMAAAN
jgi:hypothetical protein